MQEILYYLKQSDCFKPNCNLILRLIVIAQGLLEMRWLSFLPLATYVYLGLAVKGAKMQWKCYLIKTGTLSGRSQDFWSWD